MGEANVQESRQLVNSPRVELSPERVDAVLPMLAKELSAKMSRFGQEQRPIYAEVVVHAAKRRYGFVPTLSPDFDILHRYFFPARQSATDSIDAGSVERIIEMFPGDIVLLPGTLSELIRYINDTYKLQARIRDSLREHTDEGRLEELLQILDNDSLIAYWSDLEPIARNVASEFVLVSNALVRMRRFLADSRVVPLNSLIDLDRFRGITTSDEFIDLQSRLQGKRTTDDNSSSTEKSFHDASNLIVAMDLHKLYGVPNSNNPRNIMFLSGTRILRRIPREFFVDDILIDRLIENRVILADHVGYMDRPYGWRPVTLDAIEEFCILDQALGSTGEMLKEAIGLFQDVFRISGLSVELFGLENPSELPSRTTNSLRTVVPAYLRDCLRSSNRRTSRLSSREWQRRIAGSVSAKALKAQVQTKTLDTERELLNLGIEVVRQEFNKDRPSECNGLVAMSPYTADIILTFEHWVHYGFASVQFPSDLSALEIVEFLNAFGRKNREVEGELAAWFEINCKEIKPISNLVRKHSPEIQAKKNFDTETFSLEQENSHLFPLVPISMMHSVSLQDFAIESLDGRDTLRPERVSILSEIGDLHIDMPWTRGSKCSVSSTVNLEDGLSMLFPFAISHLHSWRSNEFVMDFLKSVASVKSENK